MLAGETPCAQIAIIHLHSPKIFGLKYTHGCDKGKYISICERLKCGIRMLPKVRWADKASRSTCNSKVVVEDADADLPQ